ncbi:exostosin-3 [Trichonephila clavipes]|nr:exostosin-3 [Trichonephila clavipes]
MLSYQGEYRTSVLLLKSGSRKLSLTLDDDSDGTEQASSKKPNDDVEDVIDSTFVLIISPMDYKILSTPQIHIRVYEALQTGAIPVLLGNHIRLPFDEFLDWKQLVIFLPKARISELHYYLRTFTDNDIMAMRHQGRLVYDRYLSSPRTIVATVLAMVRSRLQIPAPAARDEPSPSVFNTTFRPLRTEEAPALPDPEESLGPLEQSFPSPCFQRNLTLTNGGHYSLWNDLADPFVLYPYTPFDPLLPSEAKFLGSSFDFRPIGQGAGGSGKEFSEALGGNSPREHERLPSADLRWPEIGVPIHVIKAKKNSLNNRFLPYDAVETEAVLSVDDDAHLRHDEIVFGFRVWRESRDRIVGFPGRYHAWDAVNGAGFITPTTLVNSLWF